MGPPLILLRSITGAFQEIHPLAQNNFIRLRGVTQHNLKNLNLDIPLNRLIAVSGVSGSGKSSLALHTLYGEGQRRYVETFSPYARQFLERMDPPQAELIEGIPPSIAIESGTSVRSSRSTVGTITEINDFLKLLFARLAVPHCPQCRRPVREDTPQSVYQHLAHVLSPGSRVLVTFPHVPEHPDSWSRQLVAQGFLRILHEGKAVGLEDVEPALLRSLTGREIRVVVDRISWGRASAQRVTDSIETAFRMGNGRVAIVVLPDEILPFSTDLSCPHCAGSPLLTPPTPNLFSFNSPLGACPQCRGFGRIIGVDMDLVIPDPRLSLRQGAIKPWSPDRTEFEDLLAFCVKEGIPLDVPYQDLPREQQDKIVLGTKRFYGVRGFFNWLESKTYKMHVRVFLSRYRAYTPCPACGGSRFQPSTLLYRLKGATLADVSSWPVGDCLGFFASSWPELQEDGATALLMSEISRRLNFLCSVGLEYLTLDRQSRTLSGGEVQRVHLTKALGSALVNVLYVLDEPSVGLHPRDQQRLMGQLHKLVELGNTVVVVEHDPDMIRFADHVIDMGPGGGAQGGQAVFQGTPEGLSQCTESLTGAYLSGRLSVSSPARRRTPRWDRVLRLKGARENNLKHLTLDFPLGVLMGICGVSGSGKSTLMEKTLYGQYLRLKGRPTDTPGASDGLEGLEHIGEMLLVDQQPIGRTPRANLLTYTKAMDPVRKIFAADPAAIARGLSPAHFSFNVPGGRCELCKGEGYERVEMQFLADVYVRCSQCEGRRFKDEILEIRVKGLSISDVLDCTALEVMERFSEHDGLVKALEPIAAFGLDHLRLGQPLSTLSGGEAQRLKLIHHLRPASTGSRRNGLNGGRTVFLLDEPTTGLHPHDLQKLLNVLQQLVDQGNTVLVVEHNVDLLAACDWLLELGPTGGAGGGQVVCQGPPETVANLAKSPTGPFLKRKLRDLPLKTSHVSEDAGEPDSPAGRERGGLEPDSPLSEPPSLFVESPEDQDAAAHDSILVRGAREHNLKIDEIALPREQMIVLTGLSGSGKSTLAFDVLFAEGQRRYLECLSTYVRQYFRILEKPDVDQVLGLPPTVAIEQRTSQLNRRSTVGTITEIYHFLRLLFAKLGRQHCPDCRRELSALSLDRILEIVVQELKQGGETEVFAPIIQGRKGIYRELFQKLSRMGFERVLVDGKDLPLRPVPTLARHREHDIAVLVLGTGSGRVGIRDLHARLERALSLGGGSILLRQGGEERILSKHLFCVHCHKGFAPLDPRLFSFNSRHGACPSCQGIGSSTELNLERLLGPSHLSLEEGLLSFLRANVWRNGFQSAGKRLEKNWAERLHIDFRSPFQGLQPDQQSRLLHGSKGQASGLVPLLHQAAQDSRIGQALQPYFQDVPCPNCGGERLNAQARSVFFKDWTLGSMVRCSVKDLSRIWKELNLEPNEKPIVLPIKRELTERLEFLQRVGLDYLSLDRSGDTLSGGEAQRIRLAAQLGSNLKGICYILDEPTIGLHPTDNEKLLDSLERLKRKGNTIVVVEHDADTMKRADVLLELGPGAGDHGGSVTAAGSFSELCARENTLTGKWFGPAAGRLLDLTQRIEPGRSGWLEFVGARARNLKRLHVRIPLGTLTCVTGVSGAGKSTLVHQVIHHGLLSRFGRGQGDILAAVEDVRGYEGIRRVLEVDHNPIGRTPRSIPATYVGAWDEIRKLFALHPDSRERGFTASRFSFNVKGGRCEECKGHGQARVEMNFLPDVYVPCQVCGGTRFNAETLAVRYRDKNISQVLEMSMEEAAEFFEPYAKIARPLKVLTELGLGYLTLGQASPTLSGGEAQRIKLAGELGNSRQPTLYILDEPSTGLHRADVKRLLDVLRHLRDQGHTVLVIEHNMDLVWASDFVLDIGPGSGEEGGRIVAQGPPQEIIRSPGESATARVLASYAEGEGGLTQRKLKRAAKRQGIGAESA